jgi:hypothetical protein
MLAAQIRGVKSDASRFDCHGGELTRWRENADAAPPARNGHISLLRVRCLLYCGIGKQDVIHGFAL